MQRSFLIILIFFSAQVYGLNNEPTTTGQLNNKVKGIIFHDISGNGSFDPLKDEPLEGIAVSNGREIVLSDHNGYYELPLRNNSVIFVIKPRNWMVPVGDDQLPRFFYMNIQHGATGTSYQGMSPTGEIPESVDFPLYPSYEPDSYKVVVFGDTQPREEQEIYYIARDALPELTGINAAFGVTLGDIVFDNLELFEPLANSIATAGIHWRYVIGNHDIDFTAHNNTDARGAWYRQFGPTYYSFSYGPAHYIVLDNIRWIVKDGEKYYRTGLGNDQMEFLRNEISRLDDDQLVILLSHIPFAGSTEWEKESEQQAFYEILANHPKSASLVAHTHRHYHHFIGKDDGFPGDKPHHMVSVGTVCGSWWTGAPDEYGIPHAMMSDGTPTSYNFLHIDGNKWKMSLKAARRPSDFQMHIAVPEVLTSEQSVNMTVAANIFNALPSADVKMKIGDEGQWISMERNLRHDPVRVAVTDREQQLGEVPWRNLGNPRISEHIWEAKPRSILEPGVHVIHVKAKDDWWEYEGRQIIHVR